jgi:PAS domain S-box-containing protein/diguanylate cyclase (GGDEF)-like protein
MNKSEVIRVLLIEDNPGDARLIQEMLGDSAGVRFDMQCADRLSTALDYLTEGSRESDQTSYDLHFDQSSIPGPDLVCQGPVIESQMGSSKISKRTFKSRRTRAGVNRQSKIPFDVLLLDLGLPDSTGMDTFLRVYDKKPEIPTVVLTGLNDETLAAQLVNSGAQDYLVKGQFDTHFLVRTICYSIERKHSEKALRESETRFRTLIEKNVDAIIIIGNSGRIHFVNPTAEALFGKPAEELLGEQFGFPVVGGTAEIDIIRKDRERAVAEMRSVNIQWKGEDAYLASLRDITEISKARKRVDLLANLVENASYVMIFIVSPDGQIIECNALARETFGFSRSELHAKNFSAIFTFKPDQAWERIADTVMRESQWRGELVAMRKDGKDFSIDMAASRSSDEEGGDKNVICFIRDVSKEKEIDRMKSEFISSASHEMRTPLTSIKNAVDLIIKGKAGDITDVQEKFLSMAQRNLDRFASLIDNLLDLSRIESGKIRLNYTEMDIGACIENVMNILRSAADDKSISLSTNIETDLPAMYADVSRIEEVIINLVNNAIKFTPDNGAVTVAVHEEKVSDMPEVVKGYVGISVTDTGVGIPEEEIDHIFDKFYQVESSLSVYKKSGSGLGLAIAKYVVEAHGGKIRCKSKEGEGSTFSFILPVIDQEQMFYQTVNDELSKARQEQRTLSVSIFKIKDFEHFREVYGNKECEVVLQTVKDTMMEGRVKKTDTVALFPRHGEILLLMPHTDSPEAETAQERIEAYIIGNEISVGGKSYHPCFISGVATFPQDGTTGEELINRARQRIDDC